MIFYWIRGNYPCVKQDQIKFADVSVTETAPILKDLG